MSASHNPKIITENLQMCLDAADPKSYPRSGTTWTDMISGYNASLNGSGVSWTQPKSNYSYAISLYRIYHWTEK